MADKPILKASDFTAGQQAKTFMNWSIYELSTTFEKPVQHAEESSLDAVHGGRAVSR